MKPFFQKISILTCILSLVACGGTGTTSTDQNSATSSAVTLSGSVASSSQNNSNLSKFLVQGCDADQVIATNSSAETVSAEVSDDCSFSLSLAIGESYSISFLEGGTFVASLVFDTGINGVSSSSLPVNDSGATVNLGSVTITGNVASAENEPLSQLDNDDDGIDDLSDTDDDDDGIEDTSEEDCDLDGVIDDFDDDDCGSVLAENSGDENTAGIYRVKPYNGNEEVDLNKKIRVTAACEVDSSTVTSENFKVVSDNGDEIACTYSISTSEENGFDHIKCEHDIDLEANMGYKIQFSGVQCLNGKDVQAFETEFTTEVEDDDEGDSEDDFDTELETEDDTSDDSSDDSEDDSSDDDTNDDSSDDSNDNDSEDD